MPGVLLPNSLIILRKAQDYSASRSGTHLGVIDHFTPSSVPCSQLSGPLDHYQKLKLLNCLVCCSFNCLYVINRTAVVLDLNLFPTSVWRTLSREVSLIQRCRKVMNLLPVLVLVWCLADLHRAAFSFLF